MLFVCFGSPVLRRDLHFISSGSSPIPAIRFCHVKKFSRSINFTNPFYNDYNALIDLSKQVITQNGADFGSDNDSSAFFFDVAMLFEYFIRKLLIKTGLHLLSKFQNRFEIPTGSFRYTRKLEPDIVFESNNGIYVFEVKYKAFDTVYGVKREDLFQLHTYIGQYSNSFAVNGCGLIYPISENKWVSNGLDQSAGLISDTLYQQGNKIPFYILFLKIPNENQIDFNSSMNEQCQIFLKSIIEIVNKPKERSAFV